MDFELILTLIVGVTGIFWFADKFIFAKQRKVAGIKDPFWVEYGSAFFPVLLLVLILRSFVYEPYRIPSGSLEPTLQIGDFILVNKYDYGLRLPVSHIKLFKLKEPKIGDITVFRWPPNEKIYYIKRVVGKPGDKIEYRNKVLFINGVEAKQKFIGYTSDSDARGNIWKVAKYQEDIKGIKHDIFINPKIPAKDFSYEVPAGKYFMMGDNRDDSADSRYWGFMPEKNLVGKAVSVLISWNKNNKSFRWNRTGKRIV